MPGSVHDYVTASATFLGLVYPGRGLERSIRKEHMDNMTSEDYRKVWRVSTAPASSWTKVPRALCLATGVAFYRSMLLMLELQHAPLAQLTQHMLLVSGRQHSP